MTQLRVAVKLYETLERWKSICGWAYNLKDKGEIFVFFFYCSSFHGMMCAYHKVVGECNRLINIYFFYWVGRVWVQLLWGQGACTCYSCFMWIYLEYTSSLTFPPSLWWYCLLGFSSTIGWSIPLVLPWGTAFHFLAGNRETKLQPTTFSPLLLFCVYPIFPLLLTH